MMPQLNFLPHQRVPFSSGSLLTMQGKANSLLALSTYCGFYYITCDYCSNNNITVETNLCHHHNRINDTVKHIRVGRSLSGECYLSNSKVFRTITVVFPLYLTERLICRIYDIKISSSSLASSLRILWNTTRQTPWRVYSQRFGRHFLILSIAS